MPRVNPKYAGIVLLALFILPFAGYPLAAHANSYSQNEYMKTRETKRIESKLAAEMYIKRVYIMINKTLELAKEKNLTIPENLSSKIDLSLELLRQAESALQQNETKEAVKYATLASQTFMPVAFFVWKSLTPEEKKSIEETAIINAIQTRLKMLEHLETIIIKLNESGAPVDTLLDMTGKIRETLNEALEQAQNGNVTMAKQLLLKADKMIRNLMKETLTQATKRLHAVAAYASVLRGLETAIGRISLHLNKTIELINENKTDDALTHLNCTLHALRGLNNALSKIEATLASREVNETYIIAVEILLNATDESIDYVNASIEALQTNDAETAKAYIALAVETLSEAIEKVNATGLPTILKKELSMLKHETRVMKKVIVVSRARIYATISLHIDKEIAKLNALMNAVENGHASKAKLVQEAAKTYRHLVMLKHSLQGKAPDWVILKIDKAIQWIKENVPEAVSSNQSDHGSNHGHH